MTRNEPDRKSRSDVERQRAAWRDALPAVAVLAMAAGAMVALDARGPSAGTAVWGVLLLAATGLLVRAELRSLGRADEYQRRLQLEALAVGFAVVVLLLLVAGLLDAARLMEPRQGMQVSFIGGVLAWEGTRAVKARRA
jgi:Zn-dependent protease